jgi:hypothetical protein
LLEWDPPLSEEPGTLIKQEPVEVGGHERKRAEDDREISEIGKVLPL